MMSSGESCMRDRGVGGNKGRSNCNNGWGGGWMTLIMSSGFPV